ncbi:MAG: oxidoreductase [Elusimicrobiota bacterium]
MRKPKVAIYWNASCGGCEEAVVDLAEDILKVVEAVDIILWPVAMDYKYSDIEKLEDGEIDLSFINGAVRTSEQENKARLLRKKSKIVVAFGSCAHIGGIPSLANFFGREDIMKWYYHDAPSVDNPSGVQPQVKSRVPEGELELPELSPTVSTLNQVIDVDYYLPGCAPPPDLIMKAINAVLEAKLPEKGSVLAPEKALCDECDRKDSKPERIDIKKVARVHENFIDEEKCFLQQGLVCMGPATRSGCGQRCINANMPCRGCFGPTSKVSDQGLKFLSGFASLFDAKEEEVNDIVEQMADPAGIFYFYSLASSILKRKREE